MTRLAFELAAGRNGAGVTASAAGANSLAAGFRPAHLAERVIGRFLDNIFVERLWRSLKYECVYLHAWETGSEAKAGVGKWMEFYNQKRPHSALGGQPPAVVYWQRNETTQPDQQEQKVAYTNGPQI